MWKPRTFVKRKLIFLLKRFVENHPNTRYDEDWDQKVEMKGNFKMFKCTKAEVVTKLNLVKPEVCEEELFLPSYEGWKFLKMGVISKRIVNMKQIEASIHSVRHFRSTRKVILNWFVFTFEINILKHFKRQSWSGRLANLWGDSKSSFEWKLCSTKVQID